MLCYQFLDLWSIAPISNMYYTYTKLLDLMEVGMSSLLGVGFVTPSHGEGKNAEEGCIDRLDMGL